MPCRKAHAGVSEFREAVMESSRAEDTLTHDPCPFTPSIGGSSFPCRQDPHLVWISTSVLSPCRWFTASPAPNSILSPHCEHGSVGQLGCTDAFLLAFLRCVPCSVPRSVNIVRRRGLFLCTTGTRHSCNCNVARADIEPHR